MSNPQRIVLHFINKHNKYMYHCSRNIAAVTFRMQFIHTQAEKFNSSSPCKKYMRCTKIIQRQYSNSAKQQTDSNTHDHHVHHHSVLEKLHTLEDAMRYHGYSTLRIAAAGLVLFGIGVYIFREYIRENVADEVSTVATKSLGDASVQMKAQELAVALLNAILTDVDVHRQAVTFLKDVFEREDTHEILIALLYDVMNDTNTQSKLIQLLKYAVNQSLGDVQFRAEISRNLKYLLEDDNTKEAILNLVVYALSNPDTIEVAKTFAQKVLASERVKGEAVILGKTVVKGLVDDESVQQKTGDGLWAAYLYSLTPRWFTKKPTDDKDSDTSEDNEDHGQGFGTESKREGLFPDDEESSTMDEGPDLPPGN